jgi:hypothetical protein
MTHPVTVTVTGHGTGTGSRRREQLTPVLSVRVGL